MKTSGILLLVGTLFFAMDAHGDSCVGQSSQAATNDRFSVDGRFDVKERNWSYVYTNIKTGDKRVGPLATVEAHAHLYFFISEDGGSFGVLDATAGHRLTDRFLVYSSEGILMASLGVQDLLTKEEQKAVEESLGHIHWLSFDPKTKSYGEYVQDDNAVKLKTRAGRGILISLADGKLIKKI
jgi:hypothetical protein